MDTINDDGSVTRVITVTADNGDTTVTTHTFTAKEYQAMNDALQNQIANLQVQLDEMKNTANMVSDNLMKSNDIKMSATTIN